MLGLLQNLLANKSSAIIVTSSEHVQNYLSRMHKYRIEKPEPDKHNDRNTV